jgi:hypothetical protein
MRQDFKDSDEMSAAWICLNAEKGLYVTITERKM